MDLNGEPKIIAKLYYRDIYQYSIRINGILVTIEHESQLNK